MSVFETIKSRRSIGKMTERRPTRSQIERILEAATHAPNHHKVEPWKFFVLAGRARAELGTIMASSLAKRLGAATNDKTRALLNKEQNKLLRSPLVVAVVPVLSHQPNASSIHHVEQAAAH